MERIQSERAVQDSKETLGKRVINILSALTYTPAPHNLPVHTSELTGVVRAVHIREGRITIATDQGLVKIPASLVRDQRDLV